MQISQEEVVLLGPDQKVFGLALKRTIHQKFTPLHLAFSVFVFNSKGELLVQQRSKLKKTWPLVWSNSCCGHPKYGESFTAAIQRRLKEELGVQSTQITWIANYQYQFTRDGVTENEVCPIFVAVLDQQIKPNSAEVANYKWLNWKNFLEIKNTEARSDYSEWSLEEAEILNQSPEFQQFYQSLVILTKKGFFRRD